MLPLCLRIRVLAPDAKASALTWHERLFDQKSKKSERNILMIAFKCSGTKNLYMLVL